MIFDEILTKYNIIFFIFVSITLILLLHSIFFKNRRDQSNKDQHDGRNKKITDLLFSPGPFATLALLVGLAILVAAHHLKIDLWVLITDNKLVVAVITAVFGLLLVERMREYTERLSKAGDKIHELDKKIDGIKNSIKEEYQKEFQNRIDQALDNFEKYAEEYSWIKKIIDDHILDNYPNLRRLTEKALEKISVNDFETGYEIFKKTFDKKELGAMFATTNDIEFSTFVSFFIIGDAGLTRDILFAYKDLYKYNAYYSCMLILHSMLASNRESALLQIDWINKLKSRSRLYKKYKLLQHVFTKKQKDALNVKISMCNNWAMGCICCAEALMRPDVMRFDLEYDKLIKNVVSTKDQHTKSIFVVQINIIANTPERGIAYLDSVIEQRRLSIIEFYLYLILISECSNNFDKSKLKKMQDHVLLRTRAEFNLSKIVAALLDSLETTTKT